MQQIKEQIEENKYSLWPRNSKQSGIEKVELTINEITNCVDMRLYHNEVVGINHVYLDCDEQQRLNRQTKRLQNNLKRIIQSKETQSV